MQTLSADAPEEDVIRSFLFVPADSERKLKKSQGSSADALILDLEDSVAAQEKPRGRSLACEFLSDRGEMAVWVRVNALNSPFALDDLKAVVPARPDGIVLPKPASAHDAVQLGKLLGVLEQESGIEEGTIPILPIATESPAALFHLDGYVDATPRLKGLSWGAEDLSAALGAATNRDESGNWLPPYELARSLCLFAAAAAGVDAIDTVYADFKNTDGLSRYASNARRDGFSGMLAIHPAQVDIITDAFSPSAEELARAQRIVALFADNPDAGVVSLDGQMLDKPHLVQAQNTIATVEQRKKA